MDRDAPSHTRTIIIVVVVILGLAAVDRRRALSEELRQAAETHPSGSLNTASQEIGSTFWDYIAFFPPGAQWDSPAPNPTGWYFPVAHHMDEVRANLAAMCIERQSSGSP